MTIIWSCSDDDYSYSSSDRLMFSYDTIRIDTVFSNIPTPTTSFWVYNRTGKNIRLQSVRLERGNQSGFRVNVDGVYLGQSMGYQTGDVEILRNDSIRVFVELTAVGNGDAEYKKLSDNIIFTTEGGAEQRVNLSAYSWDAILLHDPVIHRDTTFTGDKPIVIFGSLKVDSAATLTLSPDTKLFFHDDSKINVYGRLLCKGEPGKEVVLRGYRLDKIFDHLPYDGVSGQWRGVHFFESSYGNQMDYTDLHSAYDGIVIDSCSVDEKTLEMTSSTVHNCQGYGIYNASSWVELRNCQLTNTLKDCVYSKGGITTINNCTIAQFYPFDSKRGVALRFSNMSPLQLQCYSSIVTGYADDEMKPYLSDSTKKFAYEFKNCILRTPKVMTDDSVRFVNVQFENIEDTAKTGKKHFLNVNKDNKLRYDFRLDSLSSAINAADKATSMPFDRNGLPRDEHPDIGAFEYKK